MRQRSVKKKKEANKEKFNYCVGRPWQAYLSEDALKIYTHHTQVHYGTMAEAEDMRKYVNRATNEENFIYKIVPLA